MFKHNKYLELDRPPAMTFHFIVDNNPTLLLLHEALRINDGVMPNSLEPDGQIVTDRWLFRMDYGFG